MPRTDAGAYAYTSGGHQCFFPMMSLALVQPADAVYNLFATGFPQLFSATRLACFYVAYFLATVLVAGAPLPLGRVTPTLLLGAAAGRLYLLGYNALFASVDLVDPSFGAVIGAACAYTASFQTPFTAVLLVIETTASLHVASVLVLAVLATQFVSNVLPVERSTNAPEH